MRLRGSLPDGVLATDAALTPTQRLRQMGVSGEFVEYFGPGLGRLTLGQRAVAANMAPEYGASWLVEHGADPADLNVFASRRGNREVMLRGLFTNRAAVNHMPSRPPRTRPPSPDGGVLPVWRAAPRCAEAGLPVVIVAGERCDTGSSRDWAAKGAQLLGARAVLANSFERIQRTNLACMGVLPLQMPAGWRPETLAPRPGDTIGLVRDPVRLHPCCTVRVAVRRASGEAGPVGEAVALLDTEREVDLIRAGGIIPLILARALSAQGTSRLHGLTDSDSTLVVERQGTRTTASLSQDQRRRAARHPRIPRGGGRT